VLYQGVQIGDANAARFTWTRQLAYNAGESRVGFEYQANFGEIAFACNGQADAAIKMAAVETALSLAGGDLIVQNDDNVTSSVNSVLSAATFGGVKPVSLTWDDRPGAQFHTWRSYSCGFRWTVLAAGVTTATLDDFSETVTVRGGNALRVVNEPINTPVSAVDEFVTRPKQKYVITQQGFAVGILDYPNLSLIAPPLYAAPPQNPISLTAPRPVGAGAYRGYRAEWTYTWEFGALASFPLPNLWT
jgi:hypothetical protein